MTENGLQQAILDLAKTALVEGSVSFESAAAATRALFEQAGLPDRNHPRQLNTSFCWKRSLTSSPLDGTMTGRVSGSRITRKKGGERKSFPADGLPPILACKSGSALLVHGGNYNESEKRIQ